MGEIEVVERYVGERSGVAWSGVACSGVEWRL